MPRENVPTRERATLASPTASSTSGTRDVGMPLLCATQVRWARAERPRCAPEPSNWAPTCRSGVVRSR